MQINDKITLKTYRGGPHVTTSCKSCFRFEGCFDEGTSGTPTHLSFQAGTVTSPTI